MKSTGAVQLLKARLKRDLELYPESTRIRLHRALSWLVRAQRDAEDLDARYLFLWIAFNAAYAREFGRDESERDRLRQFIASVLSVDTEERIHKLLFEQFSGPIRTMLGNRFVFEPFWRALRDHDSSNRWEDTFARSTKTALECLLRGETGTVFSIMLDRLYVLRNQLVHGGATWQSSVNRAQMRDGVNILQAIVTTIIELMLDHPELEFGDVLYPVV